MSSLSRLLKNRYKSYYLDLAGVNASVIRFLKPTIPAMEKKGELTEKWTRSYPFLNLEVDHNPCGYRLEILKVRDKVYSYRLRISLKKDSPLFWNSPRRRLELASLVNVEYKEHKQRFGFPHTTRVDAVQSRLTTFILDGEIKLD